FGNLSVGNGWQNFWGEMGQVSVYRRALSTAEIIAMFREQGKQFGLATDTELIAREKQALEAARAEEAQRAAIATFSKQSEAVSQAFIEGDFRAARTRLAKIVADRLVPAHYRSYAHLRLAQTYVAEKDTAGAIAEYAKLAAVEDYPRVHRQEAEELAAELGRQARGLPARDPAATRAVIPAITTFAAEVHVAPDGNDGADGSKAHPFRTLARARDAVRTLKAGGLDGAICVHVGSGEYPITEALKLMPQDSGTAGAPVIYRAEKMGEAVLYGGARVTGFRPVTDPVILARLPEGGRGKVWSTDLRAQGITDYGTLRVRGGIGQPSAPPTLEVFVDGKPMTPSRWPNEGFVKIRELIESGSAKEKKPSVFGYLDDRHARWTQANDLWLMGYWHFLWADATIQVAKIDTKAKTITTVKPYKYGNRGMKNHQGIIYYAFNLLEEIDQPGEWYLDREGGVLYLYPETDLAKATVEIGMHSGPMVTFDNVSHVRFEGLCFDLARYNGIQVSNSSDCLIAGCTVKRMAGTGIIINGGKRFGVFGCDVHTLGRRGIELRGGARETLDPGGHFVENCRIHFFGRVDRTYTQAITLGGVGNRLSHNLLYNCPTSVISLGGNDHLIEYNDVHSAVQESDDQGGIDMWGNPTFRGNIFRFNRFRNVGKPVAGQHAVHGQAAIRFDDTISGQLVYGNILYKGSNGNFGAVQMNSGRDNLFDNNLFIDNKHGISGGWSPGNAHWKQTQEGKKGGAFTSELYLKRYPRIGRMFDKGGQNAFWRNVFWRCGTIDRRARHLEMFENVILGDEEDPGFVNLEAGDFRMRPDSIVFKRLAFRQIPVQEIGLYAHPLRVSWPVETTPVEMPDWRIGFERKKESSGIMPHALAIRPVQVPRVGKAPRIDGRIEPGEWAVKPLQIKENPSRKPVSGQPAQAWLTHDGNALHVAVRIPFAGDARKLSATKGQWGQIDGAEICLREIGTTVAGKRAPVLVLQGYPSGAFAKVPHPGNIVNREAVALARLSSFAAITEDGAWSCEWTIPIAGMGLAYKPGIRMQFNIGVRRTRPDGWMALAGALGANYQLDNAAVIVLE
ncbi:MAG: right-handed parallel beta-helix repeat-containing protein, partial [Lentisphaeria bacterium]|nr:right-handed parallel beta-helix repeat-containing protein [Lentisphaeria bacterium]